MLLQRMITALVLIPLVIGAIFLLPSFYFSAFALVVFVFAANEWASLCELTRLERILYIIGVILLCGIFAWLDCKSVLLLGALFWLIPAYWVLNYQGVSTLLGIPYLKATIGLFVLSMAWYGLVVIKSLSFGPFWIMLLFVLVWSCDSFAFFAGRQWGKSPLAPLISPKKTIEGFWGGLVGTLLLAILIYLVLLPTSYRSFLIPFSAWLSLAYLTVLLSVLGDLFESLLKRISHVKDSGTLLPGHGGLLDRIDSLLAATPLFSLCLVWVSK
ncbi:MAG: phosphatidate cytidylyltransferase [Candidatus Berkiella sp.]